MTLSTFQGSNGLLDTGNVQIKNTTVNVTTNAVLAVGSPTPGAKDPIVYRGVFIVFDLTGVPAGATINGCQIEFTTNNASGPFTTFELKVGNIRRDEIWENGDGMSRDNYDRLSNLLWAEWANGASTSTDVWVDKTGPAGTLSTMPAVTAGGLWSCGDGTGVTPTSTITGMTAHLQAAIDEFDTDDMPVCFLLYREFEGLTEPTHEKAFTIRTNDHGTAADRPELSIDWTPPPPTASFVVVPQSQSTGNMEVTIEGTFIDKADGSAITDATWTDSVSGLLFTGETLVEQDLAVGVHTITVVATDAAALTITTVFDIEIFDVPDDLADAIAASTVDGDPNTSLQVAGGILSAGAGGGSGEKGVAVIEAFPWAQS